MHCMVLWLWLVLAFLVGFYWYRKGLSLGVGFLLSLVLSPAFGILLGLALPPNRRLRAQRWAPGGLLRHCPHCADLIALRARVCHLCYRTVPRSALLESRAGSPATAGLAEPPPASGQFTVVEQRGRRLLALALRETPPASAQPARAVAVLQPAGTAAPEPRRADAPLPVTPDAFPLDLALYLARQRRLRLRRPRLPIRVCFLDGTVEEVV